MLHNIYAQKDNKKNNKKKVIPFFGNPWTMNSRLEKNGRRFHQYKHWQACPSEFGLPSPYFPKNQIRIMMKSCIRIENVVKAINSVLILANLYALL